MMMNHNLYFFFTIIFLILLVLTITFQIIEVVENNNLSYIVTSQINENQNQNITNNNKKEN